MRKSAAIGWLSLLGWVGFGAAGGCGGSTEVGTFNGAVDGQHCSTVGGTMGASDGCNTCTCDSNGTWGCTKRACGTGGSNAGGTGGSSMGGTGGSSGGGTPCKQGETMTAPDGCNTCSCGSMGEWACTEKACVACIPGEMKMADDGCNTCTCSDTGAWGCTKKACVPECTQGQTKKVDCNTCGCNAGHWVCTTIGCAPSCPAPVQSMMACDTVIAWAKDPNAGTCCQYNTPCNAPAGWKIFTSQSACLGSTCPPPTDPNSGQACVAVIVYAKDPLTGLCCMYPDPCHAPTGWKTFTTDAECQKAP